MVRSYRRQVIRASDCQAIAEKYCLLGTLNDTHDRSGWQSYTAKFPGALREAEMCSESSLRARISSAASFTRWIGQDREACLHAVVDRSLLLWHDLHLLLGDLQRWRARYARLKLDIHHFVRWTQESEILESRQRWPPQADELKANLQGRPCSNTALQWLATRAELDSCTLLSFLVDRPGAARLREEELP